MSEDRGRVAEPGVLLAQQLENGKLMSEGTGSWPFQVTFVKGKR